MPAPLRSTCTCINCKVIIERLSISARDWQPLTHDPTRGLCPDCITKICALALDAYVLAYLEAERRASHGHA